MKIFLNCFLSTFLTYISIFSQSGWTLQQSGTTQSLFTSSFINVNTGFVAGTNGVILQTSNGGMNWIYYPTSLNSFYAMSFPNSSTGYIVGDGGIINKTTNAGLNWSLLPAGTNRPQSSVFFIDAFTGFVTASGIFDTSQILKTTNGGLNWNIYVVNASSLKTVFFININTGFVGGSIFLKRSIFKTTNSGLFWDTVQLPTTPNLQSCNDLFFINNLIGYALFDNFIFKTSNGGASWMIESSSNNSLNSIFFVDSSIGFAAGDGGQVLKTTNGGDIWLPLQILITNNNLKDIKFIDSYTGFAVGDYGTIIKTTTGGEPIGIKPISNNVPEKFFLYQNYPNPFNPNTVIKFQVSMPDGRQASYRMVNLVIYDALGKIISELVNTELQPGTYEVSWNAENFSSGVYFYKLIVGEFVETKRMVLLK